MIMPVLYTMLFAVGFLGVIGLSEFLFRKYQLDVELTRKFSHILATLASLAFLLTFHSYIYVLLLGVLFFIILFVGRRLKLFRSIDSVRRKTAGSYLLPVSIGLMFVLSKELGSQLLFILPILVLGISDPLAGLFGTLYGARFGNIKLLHYGYEKTYLGSGVFFLSTLLLHLFVLPYFSFQGWNLIGVALGLSTLATVVEIVSPNGTDNLTVPLVICLALYFVM
jgi:phytol kinase